MLLVWSMVLAALAFLVVVGFAVFWVGSHGKAGAPADSEPGAQVVRVASRFVAPTEDEALALVRKALAVRDPAMVEGLLRCGGTDPAEVVEFMAALEALDGGVERITWLGSMDVDGMELEGVLVVSAGKGPGAGRLALLVPDEGGDWKMDFEAFARTCRPAWKDFLQERAERALVRVLVARDSYYNGPFLDESEWESFALASPDLQEWTPDGQTALRGYCRKGSAQAKAVARILEADARMRRVILEIRRTRGAGPRQFEITRVLAEEWVLPDRPFDERFD